MALEIRRHTVSLSYANVTATLALFLALGGGAYAAVSGIPGRDGVIHGCYQKRMGTLRVVPAGRKCKKGSEVALSWNQKGVRGSTGPSGLPGAPGGQGATGGQGSTGPAGPLLNTLPSGRTLYGTYAITGNFQSGANDRASSPVSFPIPLSAAPAESVVVPFGGPNPDATSCPGSAASPSAAPGKLCVYEGQLANAVGTEVCKVSVSDLCGPGTSGTADRFGASVTTFANAPGVFSSWGTWAVTGP